MRCGRLSAWREFARNNRNRGREKLPYAKKGSSSRFLCVRGCMRADSRGVRRRLRRHEHRDLGGDHADNGHCADERHHGIHGRGQSDEFIDVDQHETVVTWEVNGVAGGSTATGTIVSSTTDEQVGVYTAPGVVPSSNNGQVNITAVAPQNPSSTTSTTSSATITSNTAVVTIGAGGSMVYHGTIDAAGSGRKLTPICRDAERSERPERDVDRQLRQRR